MPDPISSARDSASFSFQLYGSSLALLLFSSTMSKRSASSSSAVVRPTKLFKDNDVWSSIPDGDTKDRDFKPVEGGPKTRLLKAHVLNYNPRMDVAVTLNGYEPEVRFTSVSSCFTMSGDEFLDMSGSRLGARPYERVRLEAGEEEDGFRLARYGQTESGMSELNPTAVFELNKYAAKRLKAKLSTISEHVCVIRDSKDVILLMVDSVIDIYKSEYTLLNSLRPLSDHFSELSRVVEIYIPGVVIVRSFLEKMYDSRLISKFNHYNLLTTVLAQKKYLFEMIV